MQAWQVLAQHSTMCTSAHMQLCTPSNPRLITSHKAADLVIDALRGARAVGEAVEVALVVVHLLQVLRDEGLREDAILHFLLRRARQRPAAGGTARCNSQSQLVQMSRCCQDIGLHLLLHVHVSGRLQNGPYDSQQSGSAHANSKV